MNLRRYQSVRHLILPVGLALAFQAATIPTVAAEEAVAADPKHYTVEFENDQVRVLRIKYGPHEKSVMHDHPANVAIFLTDTQSKFTLPDGKTVDASRKAGGVEWDAGGTHLPENVSDQPFELILVELKGKAAPAK
jgi:hypothetical protein